MPCFYLIQGLNVIVDPETSAILPPNSIGELWVSSDDYYPDNFWSLSVHTEKYMKAKPIYYSFNDESNTLCCETEVEQIIENGKPFFKHTLKSNFIRTGIFGFILDRQTTPQIDEALLFIVCKKQDLFVQKIPGSISSGDFPAPKHYFFSNHLASVFQKTLYGMNAM
jgi:acyl-CoA synthetase (AMP-forming)/AMP-acid ligase II